MEEDSTENKGRRMSRRDFLKLAGIVAGGGAATAVVGKAGMGVLAKLEDIRKNNALEQYPQNVRKFITRHRDNGNTVAVKKDQEGNYRVDILGNAIDHEGNRRLTLYETSYKSNGELLSEGGMAAPDFTTLEIAADILKEADARYFPLPLEKK